MSLKESWKKLSRTEKLMIACVILLIIMLSTRVPYTKQRIGDGFKYLRGDSTMVVEK